MRFSYTRFETAPPWFHGRKMHEDTDWTDAVWPEIRDDPHLIKADIRAYERLRVIAHDLGNVHDAHLFFRKEMASARKIAPWHARPFYTLYEILSDYGHSYLRPLVAIFMLWLSYAVFYTIYFLSKTANFDTVVLRQTMSEAAGLSFANIFAFFGFERRFSQMDWRVELDWLIALTGFETVFGFVLLFFFGLGLRNRFRLG